VEGGSSSPESKVLFSSLCEHTPKRRFLLIKLRPHLVPALASSRFPRALPHCLHRMDRLRRSPKCRAAMLAATAPAPRV